MSDALPAPSAAQRRARNARGMLFMFAATLVMVVMHTAVRHLGQQMPVSEVVFFRNLMTTAFKWGEASAVFPMDVARLIWAAVLGCLVFAEVPDLWTWVGAASSSCQRI